MRAPIQILVVDDHPAFAQRLQYLLPEAAGVLVRGPVPDAARAAAEVGAGRADLVLVGLTGDPSRTRTVVAPLCKDHDAKVLVVPSSSVDDVPAALVAGACGVLPDGEAQVVLDAARRAVSGELVLPVDDLSTLVRGIRHPAPPGLDRLTDREREVLHLLAEGLGTGEVASRLGISVGTVQSHVKNVLGKLGLHSKVEAVRLVWREGLAVAHRAS
jgi:DNA-binding NarL/FixJ family response regulator